MFYLAIVVALVLCVLWLARGTSWRMQTAEHFHRLEELGLPSAVFDIVEGNLVHEALDFVCKPPEDIYSLRHGDFLQEDRRAIVPLWQTFDESITFCRTGLSETVYAKVYLGVDPAAEEHEFQGLWQSYRPSRQLGEVELLGNSFQCALADLFLTLTRHRRSDSELRELAGLLKFEHLDNLLFRLDRRSREAPAAPEKWRREFLRSCDSRPLVEEAEVGSDSRQRWVPENLYRRHPDHGILGPEVSFPETWRETLKSNMPMYGWLDSALRQTLEQLTTAFIETHQMEGCAGLVLDQKTRLVIAAQASLLLLGRRDLSFSRLRSILVYPEEFLMEEEGPMIAGLSESDGYVVLAWDQVLAGAAHPEDGYNVVIHEFAHQLDQSASEAQGIPVPIGSAYFDEWVRLIDQHYSAMAEVSMMGKEPVLDVYGVSNRAEFFAVATESFFERPRVLESKLPELYALLREFYGLHPAAWTRRL